MQTSLGNNPNLLLQTFIITIGFIIVLYVLGYQWGLLDKPGGRKKHQKPVPLVGGIAIFLSCTLVLMDFIVAHLDYIIFWLVTSFLVGLAFLDDLKSLRPSYRFLMQLSLIALMVILSQTKIVSLGDLFGLGAISMGYGSGLFTCVAMTGIINAVNMMDGMDGLTGCIALVELGCLLFLALYMNVIFETYLIIALMGGLLAFLCFNYPCRWTVKYKIFLGDAGSMFMGLMLSWICVRLTQNHLYAIYCPPVLMLWIMALPLMDTLHLMINRKSRGVSAFKADRRHMHHILLQLHYTPRQVIFIMGSFSLLMGISGIGLYLHGASDVELFVGVLIVFGIYSYLALNFKKRVSRRVFHKVSEA